MTNQAKLLLGLDKFVIIKQSQQNIPERCIPNLIDSRHETFRVSDVMNVDEASNGAGSSAGSTISIEFECEQDLAVKENGSHSPILGRRKYNNNELEMYEKRLRVENEQQSLLLKEAAQVNEEQSICIQSESEDEDPVLNLPVPVPVQSGPKESPIRSPPHNDSIEQEPTIGSLPHNDSFGHESSFSTLPDLAHNPNFTPSKPRPLDSQESHIDTYTSSQAYSQETVVSDDFANDPTYTPPASVGVEEQESSSSSEDEGPTTFRGKTTDGPRKCKLFPRNLI